MFRTDDGGASWHELRNLPIEDGVDMGLAADPTQSGTIYLAVEGGSNHPTYQGRILASTDAGQTGTTLPFPTSSQPDHRHDRTDTHRPRIVGNVYVSLDRGQA